ncbi:ribosomal protein S18 acetylase RimI-like enzyme [Streptomyces sp. 3330]|nr:GNAT family N-acetyltransferase [Streptomyces sp. 3330]MDR6979854.1 ribosomal protein S18 acetylase RimI-like enzyme [Streptomyces sp. 3330]
MSDPLRDRIERYYATVPLLFADAEDFGPLRLFVRKEPGAPYYGGPSHARPTGTAPVGATDIARVRARQRELGVPESFEWLAESAPALRERIEAAGCLVLRRPLMVLPPDRPLPPQPLPGGVTLRALTPDDPALPAALALPRLAFAKEPLPEAHLTEEPLAPELPATELPATRPLATEPPVTEPSPATGSADRTELSRLTEALTADGTVATVAATIRAGHKTLVAALAPDGTPLAVGHYHPAHGTTEIGGIGTLPSARRQGLAAAVTAALVAHARAHGVETVFLAYAEETVARIYARLGFRPAGTTLLIADQPARS